MLISIPVVFVQVTDPVGTGFIASLAHHELIREMRPSLAKPACCHHRFDATLSIAQRFCLPPFVTDGGLMTYGIDKKDMYRQSASYVDRVLRGEKPGELPVQASNKFELIINLRAAKAIGSTVPPARLARADEVIE